MPKNNKPDFWTWIGWNTQPNFAEQPKWLGGLIGAILLLCAGLLALLAVGVIAQTFGAVFFNGFPSNGAEDIRNLGLSTAAVIGLPFLVWRSIVAQRQADTAEQGLITDRINKAVEGLGAVKVTKQQRRDKKGNLTYAKKKNPDGEEINDYSQPAMMETTEPNFEVRLGALYSLQRIAEDSPRDRGQILDMLCAYIRENARASDAEPSFYEQYTNLTTGLFYGPPMSDLQVMETLNLRDDPDNLLSEPATAVWIGKTVPPRNDIATSLTILRNILSLCRRENTNVAFSRDLSGSNLRRAKLEGFDFTGWDLSKSYFDGAVIHKCVFSGCNMSWTHWVGTEIRQTRLHNNNLTGTHFFRSKFHLQNQIDLSKTAPFPKTVFKACEFDHSAFTSEGTVSDVDFSASVFLWAQFSLQEFSSCDFNGAQFSEHAKPSGVVFKLCKFDSETVFPEMEGTGNAFRGCNLADLHMQYYDAEHWFLAHNSRLPTTLTPEEVAQLRQEQNKTDDFHHDWRQWQRSIGFQPDENQQ
jgi:uncharacterized protein YjbI with pentapeptide repeats